jgi:acetyl-CoA carboxylase carboxyl transferase subunit alpha
MNEKKSNHDIGFVLPLEQPIVALQSRIDALKALQLQEVMPDVQALEARLETLILKIFSNITPWQIVSLSRHPNRPHTSDYLTHMCDTFIPLQGDRCYQDDTAIIGGLATIQEYSVVIIGQEKGCNTVTRIHHHFGMPHPEGYRKALRLMKLAEQFQLPVVTLIDTPGAYPGVSAERHNQSGAIAVNLMEMSDLSVPIVSVVIGEGSSGGALALSVADVLMMLEYSIYAVISPEGCSSILWKTAEQAQEAAEALQLTAHKLQQLSIVDTVIKEPPGGAHRNPLAAIQAVKAAVVNQLSHLMATPRDTLLARRLSRLASYGNDYLAE